MAADKTIKAIIDATEKAIADFQKGVPGVQRGLQETLLNELKELQTKDGKILNSVQNLKLINGLKNKLERLIISEGYKDDVKKFIQAFDAVASLQVQYFAAFNYKFKPSKTLPMIQRMAVDKTVNDLLGQGLQSNVVDRLHGILSDNVTSGGSYASLTKQLQEHLVGDNGAMARYARTITTDAINQYSAQYHEALAQDLNFNWGRYVGSNIETTREFCENLAEKEWAHKSELPKILAGDIDGHKCKLSKSTGLPLGMIPGTTPENFKIRRGGYNCGHQWFWVPDSAVPDDVKRKFVAPSTQPKKKVNLKALKFGNFQRFLDNPSLQKRLSPFFPELTKQEKTAIFGYTDDEYYSLNRYLRKESVQTKNDYLDNYAALLSNALQAAKATYQGWVFRGINASKTELKGYYDAFKNGSTVVHNDFTSTSHTIGAAFGGGVRFSIYSKRGVKIEELSQHTHEKEVLFNSGTEFKIISIHEDANGIVYIKMEEI